MRRFRFWRAGRKGIRLRARWTQLLYVPGLVYDGVLGTLLRGVRRRVTAAVSAAGDPRPCLDICCGTGSQCRALARAGVSVMGIDMKLGMAGHAAARSPGIPFLCADALVLPFRDARFGSIILSFALHDKAPAERMRILDEARRVLGPEGRMIVVDFEPAWNHASRRGFRFTELIERFAGNPHYRNGREFLRSGGLRAFVRAAGLTETARHDVEAGAFSIVVASPRGAAAAARGLSKERCLRRTWRREGRSPRGGAFSGRGSPRFPR